MSTFCELHGLNLPQILRWARPATASPSQFDDAQAFEDLQKRDTTLFAAVHQCIWDRMIAEEGITMDEWRKRGLKQAVRIERIRAALRESGSLSMVDGQSASPSAARSFEDLKR